ncbi:MAG: hypothetical protein HKN70_03260, partial [Gammaproteobacteria bacterium]|nr:hypothetical protein [Gammaproteobacteria bacterium]
MTITFSSQKLLQSLRSISVTTAAIIGTLAVGLSVHAQQITDRVLENPGMVISQVWEDTNRNGLQDSTEAGIPGVTVSLLTCEGAFVMSSVTGDFGAASFAAEAGCYRLYYEELQGHRYCPAGSGVNPQTDSDVDPSTRLSAPFEIIAGSYRIDVDAGIASALGAQIGDRVWHDQNANGIQDIGEPGMPGVSLDLLDCGGNIMRDETGARVTVASDDAGNFLFESVTSGCYRVGVTAAADDVVTTFQSGDAATDSDIEPDTMQSPPIDLASNDTRYDLDVGLYRHGRVGDRVWLDNDRDGVQGSADAGLADVLVLLLDENGVPTGITATTDSNGYYRFGQLRPGDYRLQFVIPDGYAATRKNHGASDKLDSDANSLGISDTFSVTSDQKEPSFDFGLVTRQALTMAIEKTTNGNDADEPPGPYIEVGADVTWEYTVTNTGDQTVFDLVITDDQGVEVSCPDDSLIPGEVVTCTGTGVAVAGQYSNTATAVADDGSDDPVTIMVTDVSHYFGSDPDVWIRKTTNGIDADVPPGPTVPVGTPVNWIYTIENTGNVPLTDINVVDDQGVTVTCPFTALNPGVIMNCTGSGTAVAGQYANVGTVTATPPVGAPVTDFDPSHYQGAAVGPMIQKYTNGIDADTLPGPSIPVGETVTWTYEVINDTPFPITSLTVTDNQGVVVVCPQNFLAPGQTIECTGTGVASAGQYANVGTACGIVEELEYCDADPSHYFGSNPNIWIRKTTNGVDADLPPGPSVAVGSMVNWVYTVENTGNVPLSDIMVTDDQGVAVSCPATTLDPGVNMNCTGSGTAVAGQYANVGTVSGTPPVGAPVSDFDPSHYFGAEPNIRLVKSTNGS